MKKELLIPVILIVAGLILGYVFFKNIPTFGGTAQSYPEVTIAATSSMTTVGPQENIRVVATTTTARSYLILGNTSINIPVFCRADQDKRATVNQGIMIASSTSYEFSGPKGNLFTGSVRCTATASTSLTVTEY